MYTYPPNDRATKISKTVPQLKQCSQRWSRVVEVLVRSGLYILCHPPHLTLVLTPGYLLSDKKELCNFKMFRLRRV